MFLFYSKCKNSTQSANNICVVYGAGAVDERTVQKLFARFKADDFNLEDQERPSNPCITNKDYIETLIEINPRYKTRELL